MKRSLPPLQQQQAAAKVAQSHVMAGSSSTGAGVPPAPSLEDLLVQDALRSHLMGLPGDPTYDYALVDAVFKDSDGSESVSESRPSRHSEAAARGGTLSTMVGEQQHHQEASPEPERDIRNVRATRGRRAGGQPAASPTLRATASEGQLSVRFDDSPGDVRPSFVTRREIAERGYENDYLHHGYGEQATTNSIATTPSRRKPLGHQLNDMDTRLRPASPGADATSDAKMYSPEGLRKALRAETIYVRLIDLFRKFDTNQSGDVDKKEFVAAVMATIGSRCSKEMAAKLFVEFDMDGSGKISYKELRDTLKAVDQRLAKVTIAKPDLPVNLQARKHEVLHLHEQFEKQSLVTGPTASVKLPSFMEVLKLKYPRDSKEVLSRLQQYANEHVTAKEAASEAKTREGDLALIESLDADGNGSISISEFMGLCKLTGLGKAHMRRKFREKDYGNAGELNQHQMREILEELRSDSKVRDAQRKGQHGQSEVQLNFSASGTLVPVWQRSIASAVTSNVPR